MKAAQEAQSLKLALGHAQAQNVTLAERLRDFTHTMTTKLHERDTQLEAMRRNSSVLVDQLRNSLYDDEGKLASAIEANAQDQLNISQTMQQLNAANSDLKAALSKQMEKA